MGRRAVDVVPISETRARLTELAEDVVGRGHERLLTQNGAGCVALVDARRLDEQALDRAPAAPPSTPSMP